MTLSRLEDGSVRVAHLDKWHLEMLRSIPALAGTGDDEKVRHRLFPLPFAPGDATEEQFRDWDELVRPDIERLFADSLQRVSQDVETAVPEPPEPQETEDVSENTAAPDASAFPEPPESPAPRRKRRKKSRSPGISPPDEEARARWCFLIPADHVEDWYRAMNQVRLVLSEKYEAHRTDNAHIAGMFVSGNMEALIQYELFSSLCFWWVNALLRP